MRRVKIRCDGGAELFFAPRPKLSLGLRLIRGTALCAMLIIGALSTLAYFNIFFQRTPFILPVNAGRGSTDFLLAYLRTISPWILTETVVLVVLWRAYLLRRWSCMLCCAVAWIIWLEQAFSPPEDADFICKASIFGGLVLLPTATVQIVIQWRHLKSDF